MPQPLVPCRPIDLLLCSSTPKFAVKLRSFCRFKQVLSSQDVHFLDNLKENLRCETGKLPAFRVLSGNSAAVKSRTDAVKTSLSSVKCCVFN